MTALYTVIFDQNSKFSIRAMYGLSDTRNAGHGSDSLESFVKEYEIIFPGWDPQQWASEFRETSS